MMLAVFLSVPLNPVSNPFLNTTNRVWLKISRSSCPYMSLVKVKPMGAMKNLL